MFSCKHNKSKVLHAYLYQPVIFQGTTQNSHLFNHPAYLKHLILLELSMRIEQWYGGTGILANLVVWSGTWHLCYYKCPTTKGWIPMLLPDLQHLCSSNP